MSYTIYKTNLSTLTQISDGQIDQTASDITLIGKNTSGYGIYINDNFVRLLENFANTSQPNYPIAGQLWFDTSENRLKVYDGSAFKVSGGTIVANSAPSSLTTGDIWLDSLRQQLYFNDGNSTKLAGPVYTAQQGQSGFIVEDIIDTNGINHTIALLYVAQSLIGIFSKDAFTPATAIAGFSGSINVGFTGSTSTGLLFGVLASKASALVAADGTLKTAENFLNTGSSSATVGTLSIQNSVPLILGTNANTEIDVSSTLFQIKSNQLNQNFQINLLNGAGYKPSIFVNSTNERVGIYTNTPSATLDVNGDLLVQGNLTVNGASTTINATVINVADKTITLAKTASPSDATAEGGGLELAGTTTKTLTWTSASSGAWSSSENINLVSGKSYKINGFDVVTNNSLGSVITSAPGLNSVGTLASLSVAKLSVTGSTIAYVDVTQTNGDIILSPKGTGVINASSAIVSNVATPVSGTDATNKTYVDNSIRIAPIGCSLTTTGLTVTQIASNLLAVIFPVTDHQNNTICRVQCSDGTIKQYLLLSGTWVFQNNL
jgi:hypothetical protein